MKCKLFVVLFLLLPIVLFAQRKPRPTLLVYGDGVEAYAAAVQAALSDVPTVWVISNNFSAVLNSDQDWHLSTKQSLNGGIWMKLLMATAKYPWPNDSVAAAIKQPISTYQLQLAADSIVQKLPQLTVLENTGIKKISFGRRGWDVLLNDRKHYDFRAVIDASRSQELVNRIPESDRWQANTTNNHSTENKMTTLERARTTLAMGMHQDKIYTLTALELIAPIKNNFFSLQATEKFDPTSDNLALRMHFAQAIGATAAYVSFYRTTVDQVDVRKLQSELITYHSRLLPAADVVIENPHFKSWQKIFLTGLFSIENDLFSPQKEVYYEEIRPVLHQLYSRSQLWFRDHNGEQLLWKDAIALVKFLGLRGEEVNRQITEDWYKKFRFEGTLDLDRPITRGEFAVILDQYANPYGISISQAGEIRR